MLKTKLKSLLIFFMLILLIWIISLLAMYGIIKVFMRDGNNGNSVSTNEETKIKDLLDIVNKRFYRKSFNQQSRTGYNYSYDFYIGNKVVLRIIGDGINF